MLAKLTAKNQLTLPKSVVQALGAPEYFDVQARSGQLILTPVRMQRGDAVRAKLAELSLDEGDIRDAVAWARSPAAPGAARAGASAALYGVDEQGQTAAKKSPPRPPARKRAPAKR
jgi:hypothetical protein